MKLHSHQTNNSSHGPAPSAPSSRPGERGSAVIVVLALLVIMLLYIAGNLQALRSLDREVRLIERQQIQRVQTPPAAP
jgi:hypothetical protein